MKPAFSVISFTAVAGAAQGLVVALAVSALTGVPLSTGFTSTALLLALVMLAAALLARRPRAVEAMGNQIARSGAWGSLPLTTTLVAPQLFQPSP